MAPTDAARSDSSPAADWRASPAGATVRRRSSLPRFGLRTALLAAILLCLLMGWVGRNFAKMRREDAAIETLKQAGAVLLLQGNDFRARHPATPFSPAEAGIWGKGSAVDAQEDWYGRLFGWADRLPIRHVNLPGDIPDDEKLRAALEALATFPEIQSVNLSGSGINDAALPPLAKVAGLEGVGLFDTTVTAEGLQALAPARKLRHVHLVGRGADTARGLASLPQLRSVSLGGHASGGPTGTQAEFEAIAALPRLEELAVIRPRDAEPGFLAPLAGAARLKSLTISGVSLTEEDVAAVAELSSLERLLLDGIDDAALARLDRLPTLKSIQLGPPVTMAAARKFSKSHPDCRVEWSLFRPDGIIFQAGEPIESPATVESGTQ